MNVEIEIGLDGKEEENQQYEGARKKNSPMSISSQAGRGQPQFPFTPNDPLERGKKVAPRSALTIPNYEEKP